MSHKYRRKRKKHISPEKAPIQPSKTRHWTLPTVLGLLLGLVGALGVVELRPQISVSPREPIEKSQPFSVPFAIENQGYFSFWLEHAFCYYHKVEVGPLTVNNGSEHAPDWGRQSIERATAKTVICNLAHYPAVPKSADIGVVLDYKPFQSFPFTFRRYFRFVGAYIDNWQWLKQPPNSIEADADKAIEDHMEKIPTSR